MAKDKLTGEWIAISDEDALRLIEHAAERWRLPLKLAFYYGLRNREILALTPEHFRSGQFVMTRFKYGLTPHLHVKSEIASELAELLKTKTPGTLLFPWSRKAFWRAVQDAGNRAGVDPKVCHPHAFRHRLGRALAYKGREPAPDRGPDGPPLDEGLAHVLADRRRRAVEQEVPLSLGYSVDDLNSFGL